MTTHRVFADFNNADAAGRLRLNVVGSVADLAELGESLVEGLTVLVADDDLEWEGSLEWSKDEGIWVARVDWTSIRDA